jgi:hypothetical protein
LFDALQAAGVGLGGDRYWNEGEASLTKQAEQKGDCTTWSFVDDEENQMNFDIERMRVG